MTDTLCGATVITNSASHTKPATSIGVLYRCAPCGRMAASRAADAPTLVKERQQPHERQQNQERETEIEKDRDRDRQRQTDRDRDRQTVCLCVCGGGGGCCTQRMIDIITERQSCIRDTGDNLRDAVKLVVMHGWVRVGPGGWVHVVSG